VSIKSITIIFILVLFIASITQILYAETLVLENGITLSINNERVYFNNNTGYPIIYNNRTLLPIIFVAENLGYNVTWDDRHKIAYLTSLDGYTEVKLAPDSDYIFVNNKGFKIDTKTLIFNGRIHVPVRFLAETLDYEVQWDSETQRININGGD